VQFAQRLLSTRGGTIAVSVVAAALAAVILVAYLHRYRDSVRNSGVPVTVLVAKGLIEKGTSGDIIASSDLYQVSTLPKGEVADGAITDPATLKGRVTTADVFPGEQLTAANLETGGSTSLANRITGDERAVTVPIDAAHGMVGNISAGDHVDIYAGFNVIPLGADGRPLNGGTARPVLRLIMSDIPVVQIDGEGGKSSQVSMRVNDEQAAQLTFASDNGKVWLSLRPAVGAKESKPGIVTIETLLLGVRPITAVRSLGGRQ